MTTEETLRAVCERMTAMQNAERQRAREIARAALVPYPVEIFNGRLNGRR